MRDYYVAGDWNAICQRCGFKYKASAIRKEWTGLMVCSECYETRHPQDLIQINTETIATPWASPEPTDTFITVGDPLYTEAVDLTNDSVFFILAESGSPLLTET